MCLVLFSPQIIKYTVGLRVHEEAERLGMSLHMHDEER